MYPSDKDPVYGTFVRNFYETIKSRNAGGRNDLVVIRGQRRRKLAKLRAYLKFYSELTAKLLFGKYDLVYIHTITFPAPAVRLASIFRRLPIVFNVHGDDVLPSNGFKRKLKRLATPAVYKALMIVSPSEYFRGVLLREFPGFEPAKIFVSPSGGIGKSFFREPETVGDGPLRLGFVSRIDRGKGWEMFVETVKRLRAEGIDCRGIMAGRGAQSELLRETIEREGLQGIVDYRGGVPYDELPGIYRSMDLFVFPTTRAAESLGLVGIEAMASGTPVVASNMAGPSGYITDGVDGFLFEPGNIDDLICKIKKYIALPEEEKIAMRRSAFESSLTFESTHVADELYARLISLV